MTVVYPPGDTIYYPNGTEETIPDNTTVDFNGCTLDFGTGGGLFLGENVTIKNATINKGYVFITKSVATVENLIINKSTNSGVCIRTDNDIIRNIVVKNVISNKSTLFGFNIMDKLNTFLGKVENISFINCWAYNSGQGNEWACGFATEGIGEVDGLSYINCVADNSMESGFHLESYGYNCVMRNILYQDCVSSHNGKRKVNPTYGAGFFENDQVTFINCKTHDNIRDYCCEVKPSLNFTNCVTDQFLPFSSIVTEENLFKGGDFKHGLAPLRAGMLSTPGYLAYSGFGVRKKNFTLKTELDGSISAVSTSKADTNTGAKSITSTPITITAGKKYTFSADIKKDSGKDGTIIFAIAEFDQDLAKIGNYNMGKYEVPTTEYITKPYEIGSEGAADLELNPATVYVCATVVVGYLEGDNTNGIIGRVKNIKFIEK